MTASRPNANVSFATERLFGAGVGIALTALLLSNPDDASIKDSIALLVGAVLVVSSTVGSIIVKRRQIGVARTDNLKTLK